MPGKFDLAHLQAIHKRLFGDVYDWAGVIRTVDISKGQTRFANFQQIGSYAPEITRPLQREQLLRGLDVDTFSERAGHYLGELNVLHPFREGNGRSIREFVGQLARGAGYAMEWSGIERSEMIQASIKAYFRRIPTIKRRRLAAKRGSSASRIEIEPATDRRICVGRRCRASSSTVLADLTVAPFLSAALPVPGAVLESSALARLYMVPQ